ncbi:MAG: YigZ family protein [Vicingaceae bacterium]
MSSFNTLARKSESLYKEKGSKFIAYALPINSVEDSKKELEQIQAKHAKAGHFCSALLLGIGDAEYFLSNDDGEPSNSAGAPILGQIRSHELTNVYLVVVRYFGGTKLGVGGLISAYKTAAAQAIAKNKIIIRKIKKTLEFEVDYSILGDILAIIDKNNLQVEMDNSATKAIVKLIVEEEKLEQVKGLFDRFQELNFHENS